MKPRAPYAPPAWWMWMMSAAIALAACGKKPIEPSPAQQAPAPADPDAPGPATAAADATSERADGAALDRRARPEPRSIASVRIPMPESFSLRNGMKGYLMRSDTLPIVELTIELDVGSVSDPPGKLGRASVCMDLFSEGTARLGKIAWSEALADHAISIYSPSGTETSSIVVRALADDLGPALDLLAELIDSPGMRKEDFDRIIANRKAALIQSRGTPASVAGRVTPALVWGRDHPYGRIQVEADLDALSVEDCRAWIGTLLPDGARLWVAGRIDKEQLLTLLAKKLEGWAGKAPEPTAVEPASPSLGTIYAVQIDGAVQSVVMVAHPGPARAAADYAATHLMGQIFGGSFSSRINMNLREDKGYAYGGRGGFSYYRDGSQLTVSASVEASATALALREIAKEIKKMREAPATEEELRRERANALLALPARFATAREALGELRGLAFFGLDFDWFERYQKELTEVGSDDVHKAARDHLADEGVVVLVVGDLRKPAKDAGGATIGDELKRLADERLFGEGGLVGLDADGRPL